MPSPNRARFAPLSDPQIEQWLEGKRPRPLLAIPFYGPIPSGDGKGRDLDGEYFDGRTDIYPTLFPERPILWHHGVDPTGLMGAGVLGKATDLRLGIDGEGGDKAEGWWVDAWIMAGERRRSEIEQRRMASFAKIARSGAPLYGSSAPLKSKAPFYVAEPDGHIAKWAYAEQTISTSPQNTLSTFGPMKAHLPLFDMAGVGLDPSIRDLLSDLDNLGSDLLATSGDRSGDPAAMKAGRVLASSAEEDIRAALDALSRVLDRHIAAMARHDAQEEPATQP
jgi:hypothetical protein